MLANNNWGWNFFVQKARHQEGLATSIEVSPYNIRHALMTGSLCLMIFDHTRAVSCWVRSYNFAVFFNQRKGWE